MSFKRIGPYELTRSDLIAASLVISFSTGATSARVKAALFVVVGLVMVAGGLMVEEPFTAVFGLFFLLLIFVISPALRSRKGSKEIYLDYSQEGIVVETPSAKTTYRWATIRSAKQVGSRIFIMISDGCALVIPDRSTTRENMDSLMRTVAQHQSFVGL